VGSRRRWVLAGSIIVLSAFAVEGYVAWSWLPRTWSFTRARWRFARATSRGEMARDYLARCLSPATDLNRLLADLGEPDRSSGDYWEYAVSYAGLGPRSAATPAFQAEPALVVWFEGPGHRASRFVGLNLEPAAAPGVFDPGLWQRYAHFPDQRRPLAAGLVGGAALRGASRAELREALGLPDFGELMLEYRVGRAGEHGGTGGSRLVFTVDAYDRVVRAALDEARD